jgi:hypothetical protein
MLYNVGFRDEDLKGNLKSVGIERQDYSIESGGAPYLQETIAICQTERRLNAACIVMTALFHFAKSMNTQIAGVYEGC